jgi:hypothetical protein
MRKPLVKKSMGAGKHGWNTQQIGTDGPVRCEICGTDHPENREQSYYLSDFLGYRVVDHCCGKIIDLAYLGLGKVFALAFLKEFADDPGGSRFYIFLNCLKDAMKTAEKKLAEVSGQVAEISKVAGALGKP